MEYKRFRGVLTRIDFPLVDFGTTDYESTPVSFVSGEVRIKKDDGAFVNTTNLPGHLEDGVYYLELTVTEMTADRITIKIIDATAPKAWEDQTILVSTLIAKLVLDEPLTGVTHNVPTSLGRRARSIPDVVSGSVNDVAPTVSSFKTDLVGGHDNHYSDQTIFFTSGNLKDISRIIVTFNDTNKAITLDEDLPEAPADTDTFDINPVHIHPISQIADIVWNAIISKSNYNVPQSAARALRELAEGVVTDGAVDDVSASTIVFVSNLTSVVDGFYNDTLLRFTSGALDGQARPILAYNGTTKAITVDEPWSEAPSDMDEFIIYADHIHPVIQIAQGIIDAFDIGIRKNTAFSDFEFVMIASSDNATPKAGLSITAQKSIDGGAFIDCDNGASEISNGTYKIDLSADDLNGDIITLKFTADGAVDRLLTIKTTSQIL